MTKNKTYFQAFGYQLNSIKPVHLANGFFLALMGKHYKLEWLNKFSVIQHNKGLIGDYETPQLHDKFIKEKIIDSQIDIEKFGNFRKQINAIVANDDAVYATFDNYKSFGNDYTISGSNMLCGDKKYKDGFSGYFLYRVFDQTNEGRQLLEIAKNKFNNTDDTVKNLLQPIINNDDSLSVDVGNTYQKKLGLISDSRLSDVATVMEKPTSAIFQALKNAEHNESRYAFLRQLTISLGIWLCIYLIQEGSKAASLTRVPPLFCDFTGQISKKCRNRSSICYSRQRELICRAFEFWHRSGRVSELKDFKNNKTGEYNFKDVERHFSDLAVRIGLAQPRSARIRLKHYELQPDTIRTLIMSVISENELVPFQELANRLRDIWTISLGGCDDDAEYLSEHGIIGLDEDDDLRVNRRCFISQLKMLGLAFEPSDGLVLCGFKSEIL